MVKVEITNLKTNQLGWGSTFPDQQSADIWVAQGIASNWWGFHERVLTADPQGIVTDLDGSNVDTTELTPSGTIDDSFGNTLNQYTLPAQYSITQKDITEEYERNQAVAKGLKAQTLGAQIIAQVWAINESNPSLTSLQFAEILADPTLQQIERLLWNGSLKTARAMIANLSTTFYTEEQIASILALIDNSGLI